MFMHNAHYLPADGRELQFIPPSDGAPPNINTKELPPEVVTALKRLGYSVNETPMSSSDRVEYSVPPASSSFAPATIIEPSQQLADNYSQLLASQSKPTFDQPYIPYLSGV